MSVSAISSTSAPRPADVEARDTAAADARKAREEQAAEDAAAREAAAREARKASLPSGVGQSLDTSA